MWVGGLSGTIVVHGIGLGYEYNLIWSLGLWPAVRESKVAPFKFCQGPQCSCYATVDESKVPHLVFPVRLLGKFETTITKPTYIPIRSMPLFT